MGYTKLEKNTKRKLRIDDYEKNTLRGAVISFIRERCEDLEIQKQREEGDIDRLCLENALDRFLKSGKKEDAFDVYFCYLEMFVGDYEKTRRMIELLSEFEAEGSGLLMKHRDHYAHSVYVFALGLAIYETNSKFRKKYNKFYDLTQENMAAHHFLQYWGLTALFHDIGYPFELPFEQVASYFEVGGDSRVGRPFLSYGALESFIKIDKPMAKKIAEIYGKKEEAIFNNTNELFAYDLSQKLTGTYLFSQRQMQQVLEDKPTQPDKFNFFMDHAYFSANLLFKKMFCEMGCELKKEHIDALTAILLHNSLYKFSVADYKSADNIPFCTELHPLAYMLMLCDELQCWDRTAYGRDSKKELHPMDCEFTFSDGEIKAVYLYDKKEEEKVKNFEAEYKKWLQKEPDPKLKDEYGLWKKHQPKLKAYSGMYAGKDKKDSGSDFQKDIERIVNLEKIGTKLVVGIRTHKRDQKGGGYLSTSNFIHLYDFAIVLNARWANEDGEDEEKMAESFKALSLEYKLSNINQAKAFAKYLNEIGCFYSDKSVDFPQLDQFTKEDLLKIGPLEHQRWLQEHYDMGWEYGEPKDKAEREQTRRHPDMIPSFDSKKHRDVDDRITVSKELAEENYNRLDKAEQDKDTKPMECMLALLQKFDGVKFYRLYER